MKHPQTVTISTEVLERLIDLVSNLKIICRVYHADNHKDMDDALLAFTHVEDEIYKIAGKEGVSFDELITTVGLIKQEEA